MTSDLVGGVFSQKEGDAIKACLVLAKLPEALVHEHGDSYYRANSWKRAIAVAAQIYRENEMLITKTKIMRAILRHREDFVAGKAAFFVYIEVGQNKRKRVSDDVIRDMMYDIAEDVVRLAPHHDFANTNKDNFDERAAVVAQEMDEYVADRQVRLETIGTWIDSANEVHRLSRSLEQRIRDVDRAEKALPPIVRQEAKHTKAAGKVCYKAGCQKDPKVWDSKGKGWCKPHAPKKLRHAEVE